MLYLRSTRNTPEEMIVRFQSPEQGQFFSYTIPVIRMQSYSLENIFRKRLLFLLPFYIFDFEKEIQSYERDREKQELLVREYNTIRIKLTELRDTGEITEGERKSLLDLSKCVIDSLLSKKAPTVAERIGGIMGGTAMDYPTKRILKEGYDLGKEEGIRCGIEQGIERGIERGIEKGIKQGTKQGMETEGRNLRLLFSLLFKDGRINDLKRATEDEAYCQQLKEEYHIEYNG